jgi:hypothetical protein
MIRDEVSTILRITLPSTSRRPLGPDAHLAPFSSFVDACQTGVLTRIAWSLIFYCPAVASCDTVVPLVQQQESVQGKEAFSILLLSIVSSLWSVQEDVSILEDCCQSVICVTRSFGLSRRLFVFLSRVYGIQCTTWHWTTNGRPVHCRRQLRCVRNRYP